MLIIILKAKRILYLFRFKHLKEDYPVTSNTPTITVAVNH